MADNRQIAKDVLEAVGGSANVTNAAHCMTRLRLTLKDEKIADDNVIKKIDGVLGVVHQGGQTQIIIGQNVPKVYQAFCEMGGIAAGNAASEADKPKEKLTAKAVFNNILNYLSGSLTPLIPVIIAAAMFKTAMAVIGPDMLGICTVESDIYRLLDFVYDAGFYFLPIYLGYTAAKKIGTSEVLAMFLGGILLSPDFIEIVSAGEPFRVFGIPASLNNYSQSVLPMILSVYVLKHVHDFFKKHVPDTLSTIFVPVLTMLVMIPVSLCVLAPIGAIAGAYVSNGLLAFGSIGGFVAVAVIAALWEFLVMSGMHMVLIVTMITIIMTEGSEAMVSPAASCATLAAVGMALGAFFRLKDKKEKSLSMGYFISGILGGVTEPALYGLGFKYKKPFIGMMIGGAIGGLYAGLTHVASYAVGATNFLIVLSFAAGGTANFINGTISCIIALVASAAATYFIGFDKNDPAVTGISAAEDTDKKEAVSAAVDVKACISGTAVAQEEIKDEVFSGGMMGKGIGIIPEGNVVTAPCDAVVTSVMEESKHAVGLTLANGAELLIHEGLDTVGLGGEGFSLFVKEGDRVKAGDKLLSFDAELLKSKGFDTVTVFLLVNSDDYPEAKFTQGEVKARETTVLTF